MVDEQAIKQYINLKHEIDILECQIWNSESYETDTVQGSSEDYPYIMHNIIIKGYTDTKSPRLIKRKKDIEKQCDEVEMFIEDIRDSITRQILTLRYIEGKSLSETAQTIGYSERQVIRVVKNFFENLSPDVT